MASATSARRSTRYRSQKSPSARSIAARSGPKSTAGSTAMSAIEVFELERAVGELGEPLHPRFSFAQRSSRVAQVADALFEQGKCFAELHTLFVEPGNDLLQSGERFVERHDAATSLG